MSENEFNKLMLQIITNVIEEKHEKHFVYSRIYKKLIISKKTSEHKLKLAKYLLGRLLRESYRIFSMHKLMLHKIVLTKNIMKQTRLFIINYGGEELIFFQIFTY